MMGRSRRNARLALAVAVAVSLPLTGGCFAVRAAGGALADGATTKLQDRLAGSGRQQTQQTVDSLVRFAALAYRKQAAPEIEGTVQNVLHRAESAADSTTTRLLARGNTAVGDLNDSADAALRGSLNQALQQLVRDNLRTAGNAGSADVDLLSQRLGANLNILLPHLDSAATQASANVTNAAAEQLALRLNTTLRDALVSATREIAKTAARSAIMEADSVGSQTKLAKTATWIGAGIAAVLVAMAIAWFVRLHQRTRAALDVVTQTVRDSADPRLKEAIKARATSREVEPWLHDFLQQRGYLADRVAVPSVFSDQGVAAGASKPGE